MKVKFRTGKNQREMQATKASQEEVRLSENAAKWELSVEPRTVGHVGLKIEIDLAVVWPSQQTLGEMHRCCL